jgi:hypothetical protein
MSGYQGLAHAWAMTPSCPCNGDDYWCENCTETDEDNDNEGEQS